MVRIKPGVSLLGVRPEAVIGIIVAASVFDHFGYDYTITSGTDGSHSRGSRHYVGLAFDNRTRHLPDEATKQLIFDTLKEALTDEFDVVLHDTHIHVEYDPER